MIAEELPCPSVPGPVNLQFSTVSPSSPSRSLLAWTIPVLSPAPVVWAVQSASLKSLPLPPYPILKNPASGSLHAETMSIPATDTFGTPTSMTAEDSGDDHVTFSPWYGRCVTPGPAVVVYIVEVML